MTRKRSVSRLSFTSSRGVLAAFALVVIVVGIGCAAHPVDGEEGVPKQAFDSLPGTGRSSDSGRRTDAVREIDEWWCIHTATHFRSVIAANCAEHGLRPPGTFEDILDRKVRRIAEMSYEVYAALIERFVDPSSERKVPVWLVFDVDHDKSFRMMGRYVEEHPSDTTSLEAIICWHQDLTRIPKRIRVENLEQYLTDTRVCREYQEVLTVMNVGESQSSPTVLRIVHRDRVCDLALFEIGLVIGNPNSAYYMSQLWDVKNEYANGQMSEGEKRKRLDILIEHYRKHAAEVKAVLTKEEGKPQDAPMAKEKIDSEDLGGKTLDERIEEYRKHAAELIKEESGKQTKEGQKSE